MSYGEPHADFQTIPPLAVTMGDPAGIGPELICKIWAERHEKNIPPFVVFGDPDLFAREVKIEVVQTVRDTPKIFKDALPVFPVKCKNMPKAGYPDIANGEAVIASIAMAVKYCRSGEISAIVTAPISKDILAQGGFSFPGHTEYLAYLCDRTGEEVMMLASPELKVVLATVHLSLKQALAALNQEIILKTGRKTIKALKEDFGIDNPHLAVAGLNPHAGENGRMGDEEKTIIQPAVEKLREEGLNVSGPYSPDTLFTQGMRKTYDAVLCMYHDQGLIPLKTLSMESGVNITLGLPIVRTSPDHGTAFDIARDLGDVTRSSSASPESMRQAMMVAAYIVKQRRK